MEDINNALLHIKAKYNGEIPHQYGSRECAKLMDSYAKEYYKRQLKLLGISDVVGRSEQLTYPRCKSTNILNPDKDNDAQCIECAFIWAG